MPTHSWTKCDEASPRSVRPPRLGAWPEEGASGCLTEWNAEAVARQLKPGVMRFSRPRALPMADCLLPGRQVLNPAGGGQPSEHKEQTESDGILCDICLRKQGVCCVAAVSRQPTP
jgi:hypothetical protein